MCYHQIFKIYQRITYWLKNTWKIHKNAPKMSTYAHVFRKENRCESRKKYSWIFYSLITISSIIASNDGEQHYDWFVKN